MRRIAQWQLDIIGKYPNLFRKLDDKRYDISNGMRIHKGWKTPLVKCLSSIDQYLTDVRIDKARKVDINVVNIREKMGVLYVYFNIYENNKKATDSKLYDDLHEITKTAKEQSSRICEICGKKGKLKKRGKWLSTLCLKHAFKQWLINVIKNEN
tara:strand:+ start:149 stop:610 length:462 start_codon:yes stop_codon:yes gene_type:complete